MFVLEPQRPATTGQVPHIDRSSRYLDAMWDQGYEDSMFNAVRSFEELRLAVGGGNITPEDANKRYGLPGLDFSKFKAFELTEERAQILNRRRQAELDRQAVIAGGMHGTGRFLAGMGTAMLSNLLNPLDFASMFVPVVGSEKAAAQLAATGAAKWRVGMARGVIAAENYQKIRYLHPAIDASVGQAVVEIPVLVNKAIEINPDYTLGTSALNVAGAAVLGTGIRYGIDGAAKLWKRLHPDTKAAMVKEAINQVVTDRPINVTKYVEIDEAALRRKVQFNEPEAAARLAKTIDIDAINTEIKKAGGTVTVSKPALMIPEGDGTARVLVGRAHWLVEGYDSLTSEELDRSIRGWVTDSGVFIYENEVAKLRGLDFVSEETFTSEGVRQYEDMIATGHIPENEDDILMDGIQKMVREMRNQEIPDSRIIEALEKHVNARADAFFFSRPEIQEKVQRARDEKLKELLEKERSQWDEEGRFTREVQDEIRRQQADGRVLTPEQIKKYSPPSDVTQANIELIKQDIEALEKEVGAVEQAETADAITRMLDKAIDALGSDQSRLMSDPFLIETLGKPALKALLMAVRELYRSGLALNTAIRSALQGDVLKPKAFDAYLAAGNAQFKSDQSGFVSAAKSSDEATWLVTDNLDSDEYLEMSEQWGRWSFINDMEGNPISDIDVALASGKPFVLSDNSGESTELVLYVPKSYSAEVSNTILADIQKEMERLIDEDAEKAAKAGESVADKLAKAGRQNRRSFLTTLSAALGGIAVVPVKQGQPRLKTSVRTIADLIDQVRYSRWNLTRSGENQDMGDVLNYLTKLRDVELRSSAAWRKAYARITDEYLENQISLSSRLVSSADNIYFKSHGDAEHGVEPLYAEGDSVFVNGKRVIVYSTDERRDYMREWHRKNNDLANKNEAGEIDTEHISLRDAMFDPKYGKLKELIKTELADKDALRSLIDPKRARSLLESEAYAPFAEEFGENEILDGYEGERLFMETTLDSLGERAGLDTQGLERKLTELLDKVPEIRRVYKDPARATSMLNHLKRLNEMRAEVISRNYRMVDNLRDKTPDMYSPEERVMADRLKSIDDEIKSTLRGEFSTDKPARVDEPNDKESTSVQEAEQRSSKFSKSVDAAIGCLIKKL